MGGAPGLYRGQRLLDMAFVAEVAVYKGNRAVGGNDIGSAVRLGDERHQLDIIIGNDLGAGGGNGEFVSAGFGRKTV